jgi:hypothetical protein
MSGKEMRYIRCNVRNIQYMSIVTSHTNLSLGSVFEAREIGNWSNRDALIPTTMPYEKFRLPLTNGKANGVIAQVTHKISRSMEGNRYEAVPVNGNDDNVAFQPLLVNEAAMEPLMHRDESTALWPRSSVHRRGESV